MGSSMCPVLARRHWMKVVPSGQMISCSFPLGTLTSWLDQGSTPMLCSSKVCIPHSAGTDDPGIRGASYCINVPSSSTPGTLCTIVHFSESLPTPDTMTEVDLPFTICARPAFLTFLTCSSNHRPPARPSYAPVSMSIDSPPSPSSRTAARND